jgi:arylsulfatase A-like enzyme
MIGAMSDKNPNVLFVITDQQRADHNGFMGNPVVRTPNLDRLAESGMVFENAWVSNPVCMPNRSTIMTGRMPSAHGVIFNDRSLDWGANTFVRRFRKSGYRTGLIGKSHLQHGMSKNSIVPFRGESSGHLPFPDGWDQVEDFERYIDGRPVDPEDFYGFDHIELSIDHGARVAGHHLQWALESGGRLEDLLIDQDADAPGSDHSSHWRQIYRPPYPEELHSTSYVTERTIDFIDEAQRAERPWLAWCSFPDPHHPMTPPGKWFDMYEPGAMPLPESRHDSLADAPEHLRLYAAIQPKDQRNWVAPCGYGNDELLGQAIAATYGMISMVDEGVGRVLTHLEAIGVRDNTIVVFTADHGDMMGDHGLFLKGFMHYRGTLQVPMVIDMPELAPGRTRSLASSIDLGPTLMDLCGITAYDGIQGHSLVPVLEDGAASARDSVLIEDDVPMITARLTPIPARTRTLLMGDYRYTRNSKGEEQLFRLSDDPGELRDRKVDDPERTRLLEALADALMLADDSSRGAPSTELP